MSSSSSSKCTGTHSVSPDVVGRVIGTGGRNVTRICRLVGKGCWIQHTGGGVFTIEAWKQSAVMLAKDQIDRFLEQKPRRAPQPAASTAEVGWTEVPRNFSSEAEEEKPEVVEEVGRFAALEVEETPEDEVVEGPVTKSPAETKHEAKLVRNAAKKQKKVVVPVQNLGFVDEDAGAFQRHRAWVSRTRYHGGQVSKDKEEHPSLRRHRDRQVTSTMSGVVEVPKLESFPSLGGGGGATASTQSSGWGDAASLEKVRSGTSFEMETDGGALCLEDLTTPEKAKPLESAPSLAPKMKRQFACTTTEKPKMQPFSSAWGEDEDEAKNDADFARHLEAVAGEWDEAEWA